MDEVEAFISKEQYVFAAQLIQRGLEACEKFRVHLKEIKKCFDQLVALQRVENIPWPIVEWDNLDKRIDDVLEKLNIVFAQSISSLAKLPQPEKWPDYFGQAYCVLADECYKAMAAGNESLFQTMFPPFFLACLHAYDRTRIQLRDYDEIIRFNFSTESIEDVLEISGYAIIYAELDDKRYWKIAKKVWDDHFTKYPDPQRFFEFIYSVYKLRESRFAISPRDISRTKWKQDLENRLRKRKLLDDISYHYPLLDEDSEPQHPSAIIRALTGDWYLFDDPKDVFIVVYLWERPEASGFKLVEPAKSFADSLWREQSIEEPGKEEKS